MEAGKRFLCGGIAVAILAGVAPAQNASTGIPSVDPNFKIVDAHTIPSDKRNLSFPDMGIIKEVLVKPGDVVKAGHELASEDTDLDEAELASKKKDAESAEAQITAATADRDAKKKKYDNLFATPRESRTEEELDEAESEWHQSEAEITYAQKKHEVALLDADTQQKKIEKMKLISPMDGVVEKINIHAGEVDDPAKPEGMMTVVNNTPLWADVMVPTAVAGGLKVGDTLSVSSQATPDKWLNSTIIFFDPVEDSTTAQETVRVQIDNSQDMRSGLWINVKLPVPH